jgi:hypothetical protein
MKSRRRLDNNLKINMVHRLRIGLRVIATRTPRPAMGYPSKQNSYGDKGAYGGWGSWDGWGGNDSGKGKAKGKGGKKC